MNASRPRRRARPLLHLATLALALALPWSGASAQTRPLPETPPSRLGTDGEGTRSTPGATMHHRGASGSTDLFAAAMRDVERASSIIFSGNVDYDFARLMQAHQRHAVEMARIELQHGKDPALRRMAEQIIASHEPQIEQLGRWLENHPVPSTPGTQPPRE